MAKKKSYLENFYGILEVIETMPGCTIEEYLSFIRESEYFQKITGLKIYQKRRKNIEDDGIYKRNKLLLIDRFENLVKENLISLNDKEQYNLTEGGKRVIIQRPKEVKLVKQKLKNDSPKPTKEIVESKWIQPEFDKELNEFVFKKINILNDEILEIHTSPVEEDIMNMYEKIVGKEKEVIKKTKKRSTTKSSLNITTPTVHSDIILHFAIRMKLDGFEMTEIIGKLINEYSLSADQARDYINKALEEIKIRGAEISFRIMIDHSSRYEQLYRWFHENGFDRHKMRAMRLKEDLFGLLNDIKNEIKDESVLSMIGAFVSSDKEEGLYDFSKLSKKEHERLVFLVRKTIKIQ